MATARAAPTAAISVRLDDDRLVLEGRFPGAVDDADVRECDNRRFEGEELTDADAATRDKERRHENDDDQPPSQTLHELRPPRSS